jgi:F420-0:gamma-glutamyl ligase
MYIQGIKTTLFKKGDPLVAFLVQHVPVLESGDVLVITSKIIALAEKRTGKIKDKELLVRRESQEIISTPWAFLTRATDGWGINAGIDESNADDEIILLPKDPFASAEKLLLKLKTHYKINKLGVLITDTRSVPLRVGTVGRAIGFAGFKPLKSYIGKDDLFGRKSRVTQSNHADALAAASVCAMGEGSEQTPLALIKNAPITFTSRPLPLKAKKLYMLPKDDIFSFVFRHAEEIPAQLPKKK